MLKKAGVTLLLEKVGVPLCFPVIKRPRLERQICKTRSYTNVVGCSMKILHSELFPGSSAVLVLFTQWVLYRQVLQMVMEWCFFFLVASFTVSTVEEDHSCPAAPAARPAAHLWSGGVALMGVPPHPLLTRITSKRTKHGICRGSPRSSPEEMVYWRPQPKAVLINGTLCGGR